MSEDTHVIPVNDLMPHDEHRECWCCPTLCNAHDCADCDGVSCGFCIETEDAIVIHNALDMRELREKA